MDLVDKDISKYTMQKFGWNLEDFNHSTPVSFTVFVCYGSK
ncbi:hypothetical protein [Escherichia coli]|nr:hypothetical protein [Escherichia coli]